MNRSNWQLITLAAALAVTATAASAQVTLQAQVPFSFTAGSQKVLQPGSYSFRSESRIWFIRNYGTHEAAMAAPLTTTQSIRNNPPKLVFHCRTTVCSLYAIEKGSGEGALFREPKLNKDYGDELARVVIVPLTVSNGD